MDVHRSRSLGMAALIFILICLTAAVFYGAAPVRADDVAKPDPIAIDGDTATVDVRLYTDEHHTQKLEDPVTSTSTLYGAFSAQFKGGKAPTPEKNIAVYKLPDTIVVDDNDGGDLMEGSEATAAKAGTWKIKDNKVIFAFDKNWLASNPAEIYVGANLSFELADKDTSSGGNASVVFPGVGTIKIPIKDGKVTGTKSGTFSQGADGVAKVTWTVTLTVESYATDVSFTDTLGDNFDFVNDSFKLDGKKLDSQPMIDGQVVTLDSLGNLSRGNHTITYDTVLKSGVAANGGDLIKAENTATWNWAGSSDSDNRTATAEPVTFGYDMIKKSNGSGTPSDIKWTVKLNQGKLKADMSGYMFTDNLDGKQTYTGNFAVYKGDSEASGVKICERKLEPKDNYFSHTFPNNLEDKYATYCIVYHTKMNDTSSYDTVRNSATIERKGSVSGTDDGSFTPQLTGVVPITKRLVRYDEAATTGRATWETKVALKAIVNAAHPGEVTVKDTFQSAWSQKLGVDESSITIKIGNTELVPGTDWRPTTSYPGNETKKNYDLKIIVTDNVKAALENEDYAVITYDTTSEALSGWYSNFAAVEAPGLRLQWPFTEPIKYVVNRETMPAVEKPEAESKVSWVENFDWHTVDGSDEKGAWNVDWTVYANRQKGNKGANGEFEYYGAGKLGGKPLNIVDSLPDGMSYVANSAKYTLVQNPYDKHTGLHRGGEAKEVVTGRTLAADNVSRNGNTVTFSIPTTELESYAGYAKLTYKTAVKRGELDTSTNEVKFTNKASAGSGVKKFDSGKGDVIIKNNVIKKSGEQVANSNRIKYTILVNESAVALKNGTDFLELVDTMDAKCALVPSTLKVYERVNNDWSELADKDYSSKMEQVNNESGSCTRLTLNVPDEKYLKVEYEVIPSGNPGNKVPLSNTAMLTGVKDGSATDDQTWEIKKASASAGGNGYGITMTKYDAQQVGATLERAEFTLYSVNMDQVATVGIENARTKFEAVPTDANGKISFGAEGKAMVNCVLYQLVETKAPDGYAAAAPTWIMLKGNADDEEYQTELNKAKSIVKDSEIIGDDKKDEIWIYDNRLTGSAVIKAKKVLEGGTFKAGQFSFELKDAEGKVLQTVTNDAEGNVSFNVDYNKADTYTYTISEVVPEGAENNVKDHITYDTVGHNVTVNVTIDNKNEQLDTVVKYDDDSQVPPTFINKYSTTLPEAGGAGLTMTYLAGASMLCFAATWMHTRRHRDQGRGGSRE
ncbi:SpaA isopeptide-forming pilin-related protein [Collinsella aerofaciens]|uniref:Spy0128 family protein n=1 Tax=Collinsella aerofaciens TaxID=74426 RepID=UPI00189C5D22|nr:FctA domain-containing protein [Collinsella aerofaciens]MDB1886141.1 SpaA isopeptide-forming pilin-related protein [Collinsella aerofaciens]MDB1889920.1 SpaA isopeptide-forming pilin-related protein [Collinsella aerofaciens]MDB1891842.1 SpaA isopeptide-forming pilin-related protein [Collinsella aerofaciens]MDB1893811.1 SpaA isopeptide-forming pilin-related protein [Collinsella aerofaciens]